MNAKKQAGTAPVEATALPEATKNTTKIVTNVDILSLKSMLEVCAFAVEAHRILDGIHTACMIHPEVDKGIRAHVTAPANWTSFEAPIASVLSEVAYQLDQLADDIERTEAGDVF